MGVVGCDVAQCSGRPPMAADKAVLYVCPTARCTARSGKFLGNYRTIEPLVAPPLPRSVSRDHFRVQERPTGVVDRSRPVASEGGCCVDRIVAQHPPSTAHRDHRIRPQCATYRHQEAVAAPLAETCEPGASSQFAAADDPSPVVQQHAENRLLLLSQPIHEGVCVSIRKSRTSGGHVARRYEIARFPIVWCRVNAM